METSLKRLLRGSALLVPLIALAGALLAGAGGPAALATRIRDAGAPGTDPVEVIIAALALTAELLTGYLVVVTALGAARDLPGVLGDLAALAYRLVGVRAVRRAIDAALSGALLASVALGPGVAHAAVPDRGSASPARPTAVATGGQVRPSNPPPVAATGPDGAIAAGVSGATAAAGIGHTQGDPPTSTPRQGGTLAAGTSGALAATGIGRVQPSTPQPASTIGAGTGGAAGNTRAGAPVTARRAGDAVSAGVSGALAAGAAGQVQAPATGVGPGGSGTEASGMAERRLAEVAPTDQEAPEHEPETYVIAPGDTLWDIAERHLPAHLRSDAEVARSWPRIHGANRSVLGADPDLIHPGVSLRLPPPPADR